MNGLFVTGTDTGVGKTMVAAACMHRFRSNRPLCYWKPVQTGIERDDDTATVRRLGKCTAAEIFDHGIRLPQPVSPHLAARRAGVRIDLDSLIEISRTFPASCVPLVEGAGGLLVPLNETETIADLVAALELAVLVVARDALGTINHTLLTLAVLRQRSLPIAGVIINGAPDPQIRGAIEGLGGSPIIAQVPRFSPLTPDSLGNWARIELDPAGMLLEFLQ